MKQRPVPTPPPATEDDDVAALHLALKGVAALAAPNRVQHQRSKPAPQPLARPLEPAAAAAPPAPCNPLLEGYRSATPLKAQNRVGNLSKSRAASTVQPNTAPSGEFASLLGPAIPLERKNRIWLDRPRPSPQARQLHMDNQQVLQDSLSDQLTWTDEDDNGDELLFLRPGLPRDILRKLRRGDWVVQAEIDFHGCTTDEAREQLVAFMHTCLGKGLRCLRMVHGKGLSSPNREPVIKPKLRSWLMQREEVLAFCPAQPFDGGCGAAIVLIRGPKGKT